MRISPVRLAASVILAVAFATFGCASRPEAEKNAAEQAVSAAKAAGADKYASSDFAAATDALKTAEGEMGARKYPEAKTAYVKAEELAEKAAKAVEAGKAAMKSQVEQQLADTEKRWQKLEAEAKATAKKFKADQKQAWEADAKAATESLQAAKAAASDDPASAKEKLSTVAAILDKWEAELKALATPMKEAKKPEKK